MGRAVVGPIAEVPIGEKRGARVLLDEAIHGKDRRNAKNERICQECSETHRERGIYKGTSCADLCHFYVSGVP